MIGPDHVCCQQMTKHMIGFDHVCDLTVLHTYFRCVRSVRNRVISRGLVFASPRSKVLVRAAPSPSWTNPKPKRLALL